MVYSFPNYSIDPTLPVFLAVLLNDKLLSLFPIHSSTHPVLAGTRVFSLSRTRRTGGGPGASCLVARRSPRTRSSALARVRRPGCLLSQQRAVGGLQPRISELQRFVALSHRLVLALQRLQRPLCGRGDSIINWIRHHDHRAGRHRECSERV